MKNRKIISVYFSAFLAGISLVMYPAAGSIFTSDDYHGLSSSQFGSIFIPQIILAIITSLSAPKLAEKWGMKKVMLMGLFALIMSNALLSASHIFMSGHLDYGLILIGTGFLGAGFGFTITALNPFAYNLFPGRETSAVTAMHIMLGAGTAAASLFLNYFVSIEKWYFAPLIIVILLFLIIIFTYPIPLSIPKSENEDSDNKKIPTKIWLFVIAVFLYGACEATLGNWGTIFLEKSGGLSATDAALGLSLFWGFIAIGRILFTFYALRYPTRWVLVVAPVIVSVVFYFLPNLNGQSLLLGSMALGGLGMSIIFPVSISIATEQFPKYAALISGLLVAAIQLGTGFSSNLIGLLNDSMSLSTLFQFSAIYSALLIFLLFYLTKNTTKDIEKSNG